MSRLEHSDSTRWGTLFSAFVICAFGMSLVEGGRCTAARATASDELVEAAPAPSPTLATVDADEWLVPPAIPTPAPPSPFESFEPIVYASWDEHVAVDPAAADPIQEFQAESDTAPTPELAPATEQGEWVAATPSDAADTSTETAVDAYDYDYFFEYDFTASMNVEVADDEASDYQYVFEYDADAEDACDDQAVAYDVVETPAATATVRATPDSPFVEPGADDWRGQLEDLWAERPFGGSEDDATMEIAVEETPAVDASIVASPDDIDWEAMLEESWAQADPIPSETPAERAAAAPSSTDGPSIVDWETIIAEQWARDNAIAKAEAATPSSTDGPGIVDWETILADEWIRDNKIAEAEAAAASSTDGSDLVDWETILAEEYGMAEAESTSTSSADAGKVADDEQGDEPRYTSMEDDAVETDETDDADAGLKLEGVLIWGGPFIEPSDDENQ